MKKILLITFFIFISSLSLFLLADEQNPKISISKPPVIYIKPDIKIDGLSVKNKDGSATIPAGADTVIKCSWQRTGSEPKSNFQVMMKLDGSSIATDSIPASQKNGVFSVPWKAVFGQHQIMCHVDSVDSVNESDEKNNKWVIFAKVGRPLPTDLIVKKVWVDASDGGPLVEGKEAFFKCSWERTGMAPSKPFVVSRYYNGTHIGSNTFDPSKTSGVSSSWWKAVAGEGQFYCFVDSMTEITESNEKNNKMIQLLTIPAVPAPPQNLKVIK